MPLRQSLSALFSNIFLIFKDINKWLDDTPKFSEFSSPSNSPSNAVDDSDHASSRLDGDSRRSGKGDRPAVSTLASSVPLS